MKQRNRDFYDLWFIVMPLCVVLCGMIGYTRPSMLIAAIALSVVAILLLLYRAVSGRIRGKDSVRYAESILFGDGQNALLKAAVPMAVLSKTGRVTWHNQAFGAVFGTDATLVGYDVDELCGKSVYETLRNTQAVEIAVGSKRASGGLIAGEKYDVLFLTDKTAYYNLQRVYRKTRPAVAFVEIDSLEETAKRLKESEKIQLRSVIQHVIEEWFGKANGIIHGISDDRFLLVFEEAALNSFVTGKFSIIKQIRELHFEGTDGLTVSIGVAHRCANLKECAQLALGALEMAQGRGGDQVALKAPDEAYQFFGGVKSAKESTKKIKPRMVARALKELVEAADNVVIMGHRFSDLDCVGAAYALCCAIKAAGVPVCIALNKETTLARPLLDMIAENDPDCAVLSEKQIGSTVHNGTLLIVVDTHRPAFMEYESLYQAAGKVVLIDHHRKAPDFAEKSTVFYHETAVSSTCEMCTELLQCINEDALTPMQANALLAGMMLDTKNFVMHTGVRTFEAAAFLRKCGADPVTVKKLFSESVEVCKRRYQIVASAQMHGDCAVSKTEISDDYTRVSASQAAEELLSVNGVSASFVLCPAGSQINISARSYGDVNVQLIMESLGGGGHKTMAACQLDTQDYKQAYDQLIRAIDQYNKDR